MRKILMFSVLLAVAAASCKKDQGDPSITVTASYPTLIFTNGNYLSIPKGGTLPAGMAIASAYDSFYRAECPIVVIDSSVHPLVPGLYKAIATAQNKYGFITTATYYVAVTDLPAGGNPNLYGNYRMGTTDSFDNQVFYLNSDYYIMNNFNGDNILKTPPVTPTSAIFALINDSTIAFTDANYGTKAVLSLVVADTTISYNGLLFKKL